MTKTIENIKLGLFYGLTPSMPDSCKLATAFILCEEGRQALLFVPPVEKIRGATLVIGESQNGDGIFEDSVQSSFPLTNWGSAATIAIFLMFVVKDDLIDKPTKTG